jgi:hypothetical protein|eukprot:COSAG02_NODE_1193_length_13958_cov_4.939029_5_plen_82_part_00
MRSESWKGSVAAANGCLILFATLREGDAERIRATWCVSETRPDFLTSVVPAANRDGQLWCTRRLRKNRQRGRNGRDLAEKQ